MNLVPKKKIVKFLFLLAVICFAVVLLIALRFDLKDFQWVVGSAMDLLKTAHVQTNVFFGNSAYLDK